MKDFALYGMGAMIGVAIVFGFQWGCNGATGQTPALHVHSLVQLTYSSPNYWVCASCDRVVWRVTFGDSSDQWQTKVKHYPE